MSSSARASALDPAAATAAAPNTRKLAAAVEYHRREVAAAEESLRRLDGKAAKLRTHAEQADADFDAAQDELDAAARRLADAEAALEGAA